MIPGKKITNQQWDQFLEILEEELGIIKKTCEKFGINSVSYYRKRRDDKEFRKRAELIMNQIGTPFTEDKLREAIFKGEGWAIKFYLQCKSKKWRPYEKRELSGSLKAEIEQKIRTDPILRKKALEYEKELAIQKFGRGTNRRQLAGMDRKRKNKK